jgi:transcriptional regulator with XRE-family HTH domain
MSIGERIRIARKLKGLTQSDLARRLGVTKQTISQYEKGQIKVPEYQLKKIGEILEKPLEYFFSAELKVPGIKEKLLDKNLESKINIGEKIRKARLEKNISQNELTKLINAGKLTISQYERGKSTPNLFILLKIAKALGKPISYFFEEEEDTERDELINMIISLSKEERKVIKGFINMLKSGVVKDERGYEEMVKEIVEVLKLTKENEMIIREIILRLPFLDKDKLEGIIKLIK